MSSNMANSNGTKAWVNIVQQLGFPIAAFFAMGWAVVTFWLSPQTAMMQSLTDTNRAQAKAYEALHETVTDTNKLVREAGHLMSGVPAQREEQINLMKEQSVLLHDMAKGIEALNDGSG